jgi:hypothetical protein
MLLTIELLGTLCMCTIIFVLIWGFILMKQILNQLKYKNYLIEKMSEHIYSISHKDEEIKTK